MEMRPEVASKSAAVKDAAPFVVPSAAAFWIASVEPENVSGEDTVSVCIAEVQLPTKIPESVVEPVPPFATGKMPEMLFTPMDVVAIILPVESVAKTEPVSAVRYVLPDTESAVVDAYGRVL